MMNTTPLNHPSRRTFLKQSAVALGVPFAATQILAKSVAGANDKLNIAWVGLGNQGRSDVNACANGNNLVALCDCDPRFLERAKQKYPDAKLYTDFRKMLREMGNTIDAVGVGTPDHNHFAVAYMAMSMGKHVFVQKPLVHHSGMRPDSPSLYPREKWEAYRASGDKQVAKTLRRPGGIHRDWINSIKNGTKCCSDFSYSGPLTEVILLGSLAIRTGKTVKWDAAKLEIIDNPEASKMINPEAREGWRPKDLV